MASKSLKKHCASILFKGSLNKKGFNRLRDLPFNPELAVRMMRLGNKVDFSPETSSKQREYEQREIQKEYDRVWLAERTRGGTVS